MNYLSNDNLGILENSGLILQAQVEPELEYLFKHALVQDAAYDSLLKADRRSLHAAVAQTLERLYPNRLEEISATLAGHYEQAEEYEQAFQHFQRAGEYYARLYANQEAGHMFEKAIQLGSQVKAGLTDEVISSLYSQYGRTLELSGKFLQAIEAYRQMQAESIRRRSPAMELRSLIAQAIIQATPSDIHNTTQARTLCEQALPLAMDLKNEKAESQIYWIMSLLEYFAQDQQKSVEYGEEALVIARRINDRERIAFILNDISRSYSAVGDHEKAIQSNLESRALWEEFGNLPMLADNLASYAEAVMLLNRFHEAIEVAQRGYAISQAINNQWGQQFSLIIQAMAGWYLGNIHTSLGHIAHIRQISHNTPLPFIAATIISLEMEIFTELGLYEQANDAVETLGRTPWMNKTFWGLHELGKAYVASVSGNHALARNMLAIAQKKINNSSFSTFAPLHMNTIQFNLETADRNYTWLLEFLHEQAQIMENARTDAFIPSVHYWLGVTHLAVSQLADAEKELLTAQALSKQSGTLNLLWKVQAALATLSAKQSDTASERDYHQKARQALQTIIHNIPEEYRPTFLAKPEVQQVLGD